MGVLWGISCKRHKEDFCVKKWDHLVEVAGVVPPDAIEMLKKALERDRPRRGPKAKMLDDRIIEMISGFIQRHSNCELIANFDNGTGPDESDTFELPLEQFWISDDTKYVILELYSGIEESERCYNIREKRLKELELKLKKSRFRKESIKKEIDEIIERNEMDEKDREESHKRARDLENMVSKAESFDLLEEFKKRPLRLK
jgi:hypothetical protein